MLPRTSLVYAVLLLAGAARLAATDGRTPAFARQTGLACNVCHTHYPELTPFGRTFKLNGYVTRSAQSVQGNTPAGQQNLLLNLVGPLSIMMQTSFTQTKKAQPGTQNGTVFLPDEMSLFAGGEVTPHLGGFLQVTFDPQSGELGVDNLDFRWATQGTLLDKSTTFGIDLNNNPTVQDVWNSTPAWGFPYGSSAAAPTPAAAALIDGALGGQVAGLTAYTMWNGQLYGEVGLYRSAPVGQNRPLDNTAEGVIKGAAPYWRLALPHQWGKHYLSIGTYGMSTSLYHAGVTGPTDKFTDVAADLSYMLTLGNNSFSTDATWIHEKQTWAPGFDAANSTNTLNTYRIAAMYHVRYAYAFTVAPFVTSGTTDAGLYTPADMTGSLTGSPNSSGLIGEVDVMPWQNWRLQFQYVAFNKFNGSKTNYDGSGRNASDNNTLYVMTWLLF